MKYYLVFLSISTFFILSGCETRPTVERGSPNILFLFTDDQRADAVGAYGNPYIHTPVMDSLVLNGFNFRQAYAMGSHHGAVCAPSRAMLMSGRSLFHVYDNLDTLDTFPQLLRENGYVTFGTGKWHQSQSAFVKSFAYGEHVFLGGMSDHDAVPLQDMNADGSFTDISFESHSSTLFADAAIDFLAEHERSQSDSPFLAYVSFTSPHDPRTPPEPFLNMYTGTEMPLPPDYMPVHPFHNGWMTGRDEQLAPWPRTPEVVREQLGEYYGMVSHVDYEMGRILDQLKASGFADNTIVVFSSDHGLSVGSHGLLGKQNLYEHSMKAPLVLTGPGIPQGESPALVYLFDLFPTVLNLTGASVPEGSDGYDLGTIWKGEQERVRETIYLAYEDMHRSVRDDRWKLIRYPRLHYTQLYDLHSDPYELRNLADMEAYSEIQALLESEMQRWHAAVDDPHPLTAAERESMEFNYEIVERAPDRHQPAWVVEKYFE